MRPAVEAGLTNIWGPVVVGGTRLADADGGSPKRRRYWSFFLASSATSLVFSQAFSATFSVFSLAFSAIF